MVVDLKGGGGETGDDIVDYYRGYCSKGDTRSLDYSSYNPLKNPSFHFMFHVLFHLILHY